MRKRLQIFGFLAAALIGLLLPVAAYWSGIQTEQARFERLADEAAERLKLRVTRHLSLLEATRAYFEAQGRVSRTALSSFIRALDMTEENSGVQGIGFARLIPVESEAGVESEILKNYQISREVFPQTDQTIRAVIEMLEPPDKRNMAALAFDMYTEPARRIAMRQAIQAGKARGSAPVELMQEIDSDKQVGFLVYLPLYWNPDVDPATASISDVRGFIYAPFRMNDLLNAALNHLPPLPTFVSVYDGSPDDGRLIFTDYDERRKSELNYSSVRTIDVAGRNWSVVIQPSRAYSEGGEKTIAILLGIVTLLTAAAIAASLRAQEKAIAAASELIVIQKRAEADKDLLLQEMKHRIKNSITRILAIARQTAASSDGLDSFTSSFTGRLQAMANSQDLLTRSKGESVELADLLHRELAQVFGEELGEAKIEGPPLHLCSRATQAMGLIFHELATNALKYGNFHNTKNTVLVAWRKSVQASASSLIVDWKESGNELPDLESTPGFGTKLVLSLIRVELGGKLERVNDGSDMTLRMTFPLDRIVA